MPPGTGASVLGEEPTRYDADAVARVYEEVLPAGSKGLPLESEGATVGELAASGVSALAGQLPMPLLLLRQKALEDNVAAMARFCDENGALLAPHGKTSMAPQIVARQIDAGAWAITASNPSHVRVYRRFGIQRILMANELPEAAAVRWLCDELRRDRKFEFLCLVDSPEGVGRLDSLLDRFAAPRPIQVLLEVGYEGGRAGVRGVAAAEAVAGAVAGAAHLELVGVECFEGLIDGGDLASTLEVVDRQLERVVEIVARLQGSGWLPSRPLVSGGGSAYFDRVLAKLASLPVRVVLRSGCYVTQDGGFYERTSPLGRRGGAAPVLRNALELWSTVLSRPEPERVIAGFGKRDAPFDMGFPVPVRWRPEDGPEARLEGLEVVEMNDQHTHLRVPPDCPLGIGDLLCCSISHPCGAFDRWRAIPVVDSAGAIVDAVFTYF